MTMKVGELMSKMDLGIIGISSPVSELWSWTTTSKVDKAYLKKMEGVMKKAIESDGGKVIEIYCVQDGGRPDYLRKGITINIYKGEE